MLQLDQPFPSLTMLGRNIKPASMCLLRGFIGVTTSQVDVPARGGFKGRVIQCHDLIFSGQQAMHQRAHRVFLDGVDRYVQLSADLHIAQAIQLGH